jgi:hypothetical protein
MTFVGLPFDFETQIYHQTTDQAQCLNGDCLLKNGSKLIEPFKNQRWKLNGYSHLHAWISYVSGIQTKPNRKLNGYSHLHVWISSESGIQTATLSTFL